MSEEDSPSQQHDGKSDSESIKSEDLEQSVTENGENVHKVAESPETAKSDAGDDLDDSKNESRESVDEEEKSFNKTDTSYSEDQDTKDKQGLYDQPTEVKGKRDRKKVERFEHETKKEEVEIHGSGTPLGEIPFIESMLSKSTPEDLKILHRIAYSRPGALLEVRRNLKKFNGFPYPKEDKAFERKKQTVEKINSSELKKILNIFGLERGGLKSDLVERIMEFMICPKDKGKKLPEPKKRKSKGKVEKGKQTKTKKRKSNTEATEENAASNSEPESSDDEAPSPPPSKQATPKTPVSKKPAAKKTPAKSTEKKTPAKRAEKKTPVKNAVKKTPAKSTEKKPAQKRKKSAPAPSDSDSDDDNIPISKALKTSPPTDGEIKNLVKKLLDEANLEEVTMKKVCQKVYDNFPKHDLTHKKDFIKETVKTILS